jgi:hypothetical protein
MKPKPFTRSITFWSGILVMGFICWAWRDSFRHEAGMTGGSWMGRSKTGGVMVFGFAMSIGEFKADYVLIPPEWHHEWSAFQPLFWHRRPEPEDEFWVERVKAASNAREAYPAYMESWPTSRWMVFVPYWLLLLAVAVTWTGLLLWRARRIR